MKRETYVDMPLNALRAFQIAARYHSFATAADFMCVTPAAVSQQIKRLEAAIGQQLFVRSNRKVIITAAGKVYADKLNKVFGDLELVMTAMTRSVR